MQFNKANGVQFAVLAHGKNAVAVQIEIPKKRCSAEVVAIFRSTAGL